MSCIYKIKEAYQSFTPKERIIASYILDHRTETTEMSAQDLAEATHTSAAAWIRFSQKLGFKGLTALKVDLAKNIDDEDELFNIVIEEQDSLEATIKKIRAISMQQMDGTYKLISIKNLQQAIDWIDGARRIYMAGIGGSGIVCLDLMHKLTRIDRNVIYNEDMHVFAAQMSHITKDDVLIAVSYSGETPIINELTAFAKEKGAKIVAITQCNIHSTLANLADISLFVPVVEKELRIGSVASRNSALILTDLLYYGLSMKHYEQTKQDLITTRSIVDHLNRKG